MFLVGLTGGIASGKSTVSSLLKEFGITVIDADIIARKVVEPYTKAWKKIQKHFGNTVFLDSGEIDRTSLAKIIFNDAEKRRLLNSITHPYIYKEIRWQVIQYFFKGEKYVVLDLPLLYESGKMLSYLHKTVVVTCDPEQQLERLLARSNCTEDEAKLKISVQFPLEEKCSRADFVITNSDSLEYTRKQTVDIVKVLNGSKQYIFNRFVIFSSVFGIIAVILYLFYRLCK